MSDEFAALLDGKTIIASIVGLASGIGAYIKARFDFHAMTKQYEELKAQATECETESKRLTRDLSELTTRNNDQASQIKVLNHSMSVVTKLLERNVRG